MRATHYYITFDGRFMSTTEADFISYPCSLVSSNKGANWRVEATGPDGVLEALRLRKAEPDAAHLLDVASIMEFVRESQGQREYTCSVQTKSRFAEKAAGLPDSWLV